MRLCFLHRQRADSANVNQGANNDAGFGYAPREALGHELRALQLSCRLHLNCWLLLFTGKTVKARDEQTKLSTTRRVVWCRAGKIWMPGGGCGGRSATTMKKGILQR